MGEVCLKNKEGSKNLQLLSSQKTDSTAGTLPKSLFFFLFSFCITPCNTQELLLAL